MQTRSSADRTTTSLSPADQRKNRQTNTAHISPYMKLTQPYEERNQKEEFNHEAWEKETSNKILKNKNNNEKAEKYYTNEGTN